MKHISLCVFSLFLFSCDFVNIENSNFFLVTGIKNLFGVNHSSPQVEWRECVAPRLIIPFGIKINIDN